MEHGNIFYCIDSHCQVLFHHFLKKRRDFIYCFYPNPFCINRLHEAGQRNYEGSWRVKMAFLCAQEQKECTHSTTHSYILHTLFIECLYMHTPRHKPHQWEGGLAIWGVHSPLVVGRGQRSPGKEERWAFPSPSSQGLCSKGKTR